MSTNTITLETVIDRINASKMLPLAKEHKIQNAKRNVDRPDMLADIIRFCNEFDSDWDKNVQQRNAQSFNIKTDNWETPAPDMKADEKKKEEIAMNKELYRGEESKTVFKKAYKEGTVGDHTVRIIGIKGEGAWKQLRVVDENNALYEISVWTLVKVDPKFNFTNDEGKEDNACERSRIEKVLARIIGHGPEGDIYSNCFNHIDDVEGTPAQIIGKLIADKTPLSVQTVLNERWDGKKLSKRYRVLFCEQKVSDKSVDEFGGFTDDFSALPTGDEDDVPYNDAIDSRVKGNYAPRPTEEEVCYDDDHDGDLRRSNGRGMLNGSNAYDYAF